MCVMFYRESVS